jgi:UDP-3-O-[3-hydroxymyristoyl] glucosamine N-acyltransferase
MRLSDLANELGGRLLGDGDLEVHRIRTLDDAEIGDLSFLTNPKYAPMAKSCKATCVLVTESFAAHHAHEMPCAVLALENPYLAFAKTLGLFYPTKPRNVEISAKAEVHPEAQLGENVTVMPFSYVGQSQLGAHVTVFPNVFIDNDVVVGAGASIGAGCVLLNGTVVGADVILNPGVVLGGEGFGFAPDGAANIKVPQVGGVHIGENVEIGSNSCIDRGALKDSVIGRGTKIDNLVQIGHGVKIGENNVMCAQVGIAGSTTLDDGVVLAGQVGVTGHIKLGKNVRVGGKSAVLSSVLDNAAVTGYPAVPHMDFLRNSAHVKKIDKYAKRLKAAEKEIENLKHQISESRAEKL